jgi:hypothetical protein
MDPSTIKGGVRCGRPQNPIVEVDLCIAILSDWTCISK